MRPLIISLVPLFALFAASAARAQSTSEPETPEPAAADTPRVQLEDPEPSQGHFIAMGVHGMAAMAFDANRTTRKPTVGQGFSLRLGESLTDWLDLGLAFALGSTSGPPENALTLGRFGLTSQLYLDERLFIQAGLGATYTHGNDPEDHARERGRYGDVYLTGIGYNLYISDNNQSGGWVFTPVLTAELSPSSNFTSSALWLGVEISWWSGLTRDKLNLPLDKAYAK